MQLIIKLQREVINEMTVYYKNNATTKRPHRTNQSLV